MNVILLPIKAILLVEKIVFDYINTFREPKHILQMVAHWVNIIFNLR